MVEESEFELALRDNVTTIATLQKVPNLIDFLRPPSLEDGSPVAGVWFLHTHRKDMVSQVAQNEVGSCLVLGIKGSVGFLRWYPNGGGTEVPASVAHHDGDQQYWLGGIQYYIWNGEEIPVEYVYSAAAQFVATGQRPTCIQWIAEKDVPNHQTPQEESTEDPWKPVSGKEDFPNS